jgi:hypothetical protein
MERKIKHILIETYHYDEKELVELWKCLWDFQNKTKKELHTIVCPKTYDRIIT